MQEYDLVVIGSGPEANGAASRPPNWQIGRRDRARPDARRRVRQHRHHPVGKMLRRAVVPDRHEPARAVRRQLPGQGQDHSRRPAGPHPARDQGIEGGVLAADAHRVERPPGTAASSTSTPWWWRTPIGRRRSRCAAATCWPPATVPAAWRFDDRDGIHLKSLPASMVVVGAGGSGSSTPRCSPHSAGDRGGESATPCWSSATLRSSRGVALHLRATWR